MKRPRLLYFFDAQRLLFFIVSGLFALVPTLLFSNLLWRAGIYEGLVPLTILFAVLNWNIAWGATHALIGFVARLRKRRWKDDPMQKSVEDQPGSVAIVLPVYNEDPARVFAGLKSMYVSLQRTDSADNFDFFVLSDSTNPERWVEEEDAWATLCRDLDAFGRINYRRRQVNTDKKAGNILEFCENWGRRYRYMITLDADSILTGRTIDALYRRMENNPRIGILQTAPKLVYSESFWGRLQQFANHFYGPIFAAGLNFWQRREGNYWGHNAIIRMAPFIEHCALPDLPGREPFGGKILSHDFVEAALMQRAGFEVRLADDLKGTYEECPQDIVEHAKRDRRWCQGNMQHFWLLFSKGLTFASRLHLANGIMGYASSLLWAVFIVFGGIMLFNRVRSNLSDFPTAGLGNLFDIPLAQHSLLVAVITLCLLFSPKVFALLDAFLTKGRPSSFGGLASCVASVLLESICSALVAPVMMIYHAKFVLYTAFGKGVGWTTQNRLAGDGMSFYEAFRAHSAQSLIGVAVTFLASKVSPSFLIWMLPVSGSLALAPIVSWLLSKPSIGRRLRRIGILKTPEEREPAIELLETLQYEKYSRRTNWLFASEGRHKGFMNAIIDPYINAIRATMASSPASDRDSENAISVGMEALTCGVETLSQNKVKRLLSDSNAMLETHRLAWTMNPKDLHEDWGTFFARYTPAGIAEAKEKGGW